MANINRPTSEQLDTVLLYAFRKHLAERLEAQMMAQLEAIIVGMKAQIREHAKAAVVELEPKIQHYLERFGYPESLRVLIQVQPKGEGWDKAEEAARGQ